MRCIRRYFNLFWEKRGGESLAEEMEKMLNPILGDLYYFYNAIKIYYIDNKEDIWAGRSSLQKLNSTH